MCKRISVNDELPINKGFVAATNSKYIIMPVYYNGEWRWDDSSEVVLDDGTEITHWYFLELPE